jgi:hypothetical protein
MNRLIMEVLPTLWSPNKTTLHLVTEELDSIIIWNAIDFIVYNI